VAKHLFRITLDASVMQNPDWHIYEGGPDRFKEQLQKTLADGLTFGPSGNQFRLENVTVISVVKQEHAAGAD
jgi:hypothetical protein